MSTFDQLQSCLSCLLKRNYYLDKWIGDKSVLSILHSQYHLIEVNKTHLNQNFHKLCLNSITFVRHKEEKLRYKHKYMIYKKSAFLLFFTSIDTDLEKLSKDSFGECYFPFCMHLLIRHIIGAEAVLVVIFK